MAPGSASRGASAARALCLAFAGRGGSAGRRARVGCHAIGVVSSPSAWGTHGRPWTSPWRHRFASSSASSSGKAPTELASSGFSNARDEREPRASTGVTDREILAAQRSPEAYLSIPRERTRAFGIIAHVDHGKSTLADRLLELTGAIPKGGRKQYLDRLPVERARGITVKAQSVTLTHECPITKETYLLNLIDTPGHADFSFEVSRSLLACDGALLLVDATQGVQAQTIATFFLALENDLAILPVANKVDAPNADVRATREQMVAAFGMDVESDSDESMPARPSSSSTRPLSTTSSSPLLESSSRGGDGVTAGVKSGGVQPSSPARRAFQSFVFVAASRDFQRSRPHAALTSPRAAMALGEANGIS